ncbi:MAG TPA: hypothetical protein VM686_37805 [Polyangiaceae bacterium]|nr:hypothetical protein [Polyangiaceae bacterium]
MTDDDPIHWDHGQLLREVRRLQELLFAFEEREVELRKLVPGELPGYLVEELKAQLDALTAERDASARCAAEHVQRVRVLTAERDAMAARAGTYAAGEEEARRWLATALQQCASAQEGLYEAATERELAESEARRLNAVLNRVEGVLRKLDGDDPLDACSPGARWAAALLRAALATPLGQEKT